MYDSDDFEYGLQKEITYINRQEIKTVPLVTIEESLSPEPRNLRNTTNEDTHETTNEQSENKPQDYNLPNDNNYYGDGQLFNLESDNNTLRGFQAQQAESPRQPSKTSDF